MEGPMIFLGFTWLALLVIEFVWGLSRSLEYISLAIWIGLDVVKSKGYSTTAVADDVRHQVGEIQRQLPGDVSLRIVRETRQKK